MTLKEQTIAAIDYFIRAENNETIREAEQFLTCQIKNISNYYELLFELYNDLTPDRQRLILILIKLQIYYNFQAVMNDFQNFTELLRANILITNNLKLLILFADIICQIALRIEEVWPDFQFYINIYKENRNFLPLSFYIFNYSIFDRDMISKYGKIVQDITVHIIFYGLQYPDIIIQNSAAHLFSIYSQKFAKDGLPDLLNPHYDLILSLAEGSIDFDEKSFDQFWTSIFNLNSTISEPFYNIACEFISQDLSSNSRYILFNFILNNLIYVNPDEYADLINNYFLVQLETEIVDTTGTIFRSFYKIEGSYELFKDIIIDLISDTDPKIQYAGLENLHIFSEIYNSYMPSEDSSSFIDLVLTIDPITIDNIFPILEFLKYRDLNGEDLERVFDFLINVVVNFEQSEVQFVGLYVIKKIKTLTCSFEKLAEIQSKIHNAIIPLYLSTLIRTYFINSNLTHEKYDNFIDLVIETFLQASQICDELGPEYERVGKDYNMINEFAYYLLLRSSAANAIVQFSFYNPLKLGEYVQQAIEAVLNITLYQNLYSDESELSYDFRDIEEDFCEIMKETCLTYIDYIRPHYEYLNTKPGFNKLKHILIKEDGVDCPFADTLAKSFSEFYDRSIDGFHSVGLENSDFLEYVITTSFSFISPISKWLYKYPNAEFHAKYLDFIEIMAMQFGSKSPSFIELATQILLTLVRPKRVQFYEENQIEWFPDFYEKTCQITEQIATEYIPNADLYHYPSLFFAVSNIALFFLFTKNDLMHQFFVEVVMDRYASNPDQHECYLLLLFSDMLDNEFTSEDEIQIIYNTVDNMISESLNNQDNLIYLFEVITKLSKIDTDLDEKYFQLAFDTFAQLNEENDVEIKTKSSLCFFLLNAFNQDQEKFNAVINILPDVFSFQQIIIENKIFKLYLNEMIELVKTKSELISEEAASALTKNLINLFSYQMNVAKIFKFDDDLFNDLIDILKGLITAFCQISPDTTFQDVISDVLSDNPSSIEFVLSLLVDE